MSPNSSDKTLSHPSIKLGLGYILMVFLSIGFFIVIRAIGEQRAASVDRAGAAVLNQAAGAQLDIMFHILATLLAIMALGYGLGRIFKSMGQPAVIGEVTAGIILGPSLLGMIWPEAMHLLIPSAEIDPKGHVPAALEAIAQLGVMLYMFLVGLELNTVRLRQKMHTAVAISHASILVPFILGSALALWIHPILAPSSVSFTNFALFLGVAMAITAFPVLARILSDHGLDKTELGIIALSCAAADDVTAWCLLALVVGAAQAKMLSALTVTLGAIAFIVFMLVIVRRFAGGLLAKLEREAFLPFAIPVVLSAVLLSSLATEFIGVHAIFGAFLLGAVLPHNGWLAELMNSKLRDVVTILLLPAFFAVTGMRTQFGLLDSWDHWLICGGIILVAVLGKFGGTLIAARLSGQDWRSSAALGALMNTRGLMELVVLNIGLDLGVISPTLFAMMVIMALVTTAATAPLLRCLLPAGHGVA